MFKGRSLVFGKRTPETVPPFGESVSYTDFTLLESRVTNLENNEYKIVYYEEISSTTGTITIPTGATILLDEFSGGVDAFVSEIENGEPSGIFPKDANNTPIDVVSFDASGNYSLSGTPSNYPVALIFSFKIKSIDSGNLDINYIIEEDEIGEVDTYRLDGLKILKHECGENIPGHRAVIVNGNKLYLFDQSDLTHYNKCIGFSNQSGNIGDIIDVVISGEVETGIALVDGAVYFAGNNGQLTTVPQITGISQSIAVAISTSKLLIKLTQPIIKN